VEEVLRIKPGIRIAISFSQGASTPFQTGARVLDGIPGLIGTEEALALVLIAVESCHVVTGWGQIIP